MRRLIFIIVLLFIFFEVGLVRAETARWVKTPGTKIRLAKGGNAHVITKLDRGVPVEVLAEDGKWLQVRLPDGRKGWVLRFKLTDKKPEEDWGVLSSMDSLFEEPTAEEASTSASIRGLSKVSEDHARRQKTKPGHIRAISEMEKFTIRENEIEEFLKEGKLGEYAR